MAYWAAATCSREVLHLLRDHAAKGATHRICLRLMGKKMLVALTSCISVSQVPSGISRTLRPRRLLESWFAHSEDHVRFEEHLLCRPCHGDSAFSDVERALQIEVLQRDFLSRLQFVAGWSLRRRNWPCQKGLRLNTEAHPTKARFFRRESLKPPDEQDLRLQQWIFPYKSSCFGRRDGRRASCALTGLNLGKTNITIPLRR